MYKIKTVLLIACLTLVPSFFLAQNSTNSPYTRYAYGQLADQAFGGQRGMGGIGYGLRNPKMVNSLNPASYSSIDSMTFMLDMGVTGQLSWYNDQGNKAQKFNGNLEYVAMQFPLSKGWGMGFGFKPISHVGYQYGETGYLNDGTMAGATTTTTYSGSGGLSEVYGTLSYNFFKRFSVGANIGYMFGDIKHDRLVNFSETGIYNSSLADTMRASGLMYDFGFQYTQPLSKDSRLVFGATYSPKIKFNEKIMQTAIRYNPSTSAGTIMSIDRNVYYDYDFEMPQSFGVGATYNKFQKLTVGADFLLQQWADAEYLSKTDTLSNRTKINAGAEYIFDSRSRNVMKKMRYRIGGYYSDSYINVQGSGYKEYGASVGFGLPMIDDRSCLNVSFEYVKIRPEVKTLIDEQYFKFTVSYTFNELWFFKRKVQ